MRSRWSIGWIVLLAMFGAFGALAQAQTTTEEMIVDDETGEVFFSGGGVTDELICGEAFDTAIETVCRNVSYSSCKDAFVVNVGDSWGGSRNHSLSAVPDVYYDGSYAPCSYGTPVGYIARSAGKPLYIYTGYSAGVVNNETRFTTYMLYTDLVVREYSNYDCTGTNTRTFTDYQDCVFGATSSGDCNTGYHQQAEWGIGDCSTDESTSEPQASCHQPDVEISPPANQGTRGYKVSLSVQFMDYYGYYSSSYITETGCFSLTWL